jgi:phosphoribosylaminoimidazole (AIR) synthetase
MLRIFNCGVGMTCVLDQKDISKAQSILKGYKFKSFPIGLIKKSKSPTQIEFI